MLGPEERAALRVLVEELGWLGALRVGASVQVASLRGQPFGDLPRATDRKERGSRDQAGPAILLFRALAPRVGEAEARRITGRAVEVGAIAFLSRTLGRLDRDAIDRMDEAERARWAKAKADAFPNAEVVWKEVGRQRVVFEVTSCRLVELVAHAGHPDLAVLFCAGDARYFGEVEPGTELVRPTTIASGGDRCRFTIQATEAP
jgi:hypothetical protein